MNHPNIPEPRGFFAAHRASWIAIGVSLLLAIVLVLWAVVAAVHWLFGKVPETTEAGRQVAGAAMEKVEQALPPAVREQIGTWWPPAGPSGSADSSDRSARADVSGTDPGPVARLPELTRDYYAATDNAVVARYGGKGDYQAVLAHYLAGFTAAGYRGAVMSAERRAEQHRFEGASGRYDLTVAARDGGLVEVEIRRNTVAG